MAPDSPKKSPAKAGRTPAQNRRSPFKLAKAENNTVKKIIRETKYTSRLPTEEQRRQNGRVPGRNLIVWGRPRQNEKFLLHLVHALTQDKTDVPWDRIAHSMNPGSSGAALNQHLIRLRKELIAEGHLVPPPAQRPGAAPIDRNIRGYVRKDQDGDDRYETRPVYFFERYEDRRFNLPDAFDLPGQDMTGSSQDDESDPESDEVSEAPLSQGPDSQASAQSQYTDQVSPLFQVRDSQAYAQSQYTEQSSPMIDYGLDDFIKNHIEERSAALQNQFIQGEYNAQADDESVFASPPVLHNSVIQPTYQHTPLSSTFPQTLIQPTLQQIPIQHNFQQAAMLPILQQTHIQPSFQQTGSPGMHAQLLALQMNNDHAVLHGHNRNSSTSSGSSLGQNSVDGGVPLTLAYDDPQVNNFFEQFENMMSSSQFDQGL
ncbi:hypothetical protein B0J13DRAFT_618478 [Dactylonectria estremocensis]|uniref:Myb-like domain-containing protein n=1 Tax=Dactylonectria estremocensis TaxID=1079267 RepID=A0A9P9F6R3_9HYPO|nr:hypothetical protein B0J13DRAFT_618478 [Dactylonectria estremocensis]